MTPHPPTTAATLCFVIALVGWLAALADADAPKVAALACGRAVMIDGTLKCDDETPATIGELCDRGSDEREIAAGDRIDTQRACAGDGAGHARMATLDLRMLAIPIDVNHAPLEELRSLPGIGPTLGQRIIDARPYASIDELDRVRGIGPKTIERLRPRLRVR